MTQSIPLSPELVSRDRPTVSEVIEAPDGRHFTVRFGPLQSLPWHRNPARVVITALTGSGDITVDGVGACPLPAGASVQLDPNAGHAVIAGDDGLELRVDLIASCCNCC